MQHTFEVGDIVTGNKKSYEEYCITTPKATMMVLSVNEDELTVQILSTREKCDQEFVGDTFAVESSYFVPVKDYVQTAVTLKELNEDLEEHLTYLDTPSLDFVVELGKDNIIVGCQKIPSKEAVYLAKHILKAYPEAEKQILKEGL